MSITNKQTLNTTLRGQLYAAFTNLLHTLLSTTTPETIQAQDWSIRVSKAISEDVNTYIQPLDSAEGK
jgi:hypothetical protein